MKIFLISLLMFLFTFGCDNEGGENNNSNASVEILSPNDGGFTGFLWKPISEGDGKLVVLLPQSLTGHVVSANIHSTDSIAEDTIIEVGRFTGDIHNGGRPHFRFNQSGAGYGKNIWVVARTKNKNFAWFIADGSQRWD